MTTESKAYVTTPASVSYAGEWYVGLQIPPAIAQQIQNDARKLLGDKANELLFDPKRGLVTGSMHLSLKIGLGALKKDEQGCMRPDLDAIFARLHAEKLLKPVTLELAPFEPELWSHDEKKDIWNLSLKPSAHLLALRKVLLDSFDHPTKSDAERKYHPHVFLGHLKQGLARTYKDASNFLMWGKPFQAERLVIKQIAGGPEAEATRDTYEIGLKELS